MENIVDLELKTSSNSQSSSSSDLKTSSSSEDTCSKQSKTCESKSITDTNKEISSSSSNSSSSSFNLSSLFNESNSNTNLYVCNIPEKWNVKELEALFNKYGKVVSCRIMYDKYTGQSRRIGFVKFETRQQSDNALKMLNGKLVKTSCVEFSQTDKALIVKYANNSNYLSILTSIAADIAAVHGINPNEILSYISQLYFPMGPNVAPPVSKQRKNLAHIIEAKLKSYFGNDILLNKEVKNNNTNVKKNLTNLNKVNNFFLSNYQNVLQNLLAYQTSGQTTSQHNFSSTSLEVKPNKYQPLQIKQHVTNYVDNSKLEIPINKVISQQIITTPSIPSYIAINPTTTQFIKPFNTATTQNLTTAPTGWSIFVYNLPLKCDECLLWKLFNPFGPVLYVHISRDNRTNVCKGYGFVTMTNYDQAINSICVLNGLNLPGSTKPLYVTMKSK